MLEAVRGLLQQTYSPLDMIILDGASPDATGDILAGELARYPHRSDIRFIRNEQNLDYRGNLLKGASMAQGEFILLSVATTSCCRPGRKNGGGLARRKGVTRYPECHLLRRNSVELGWFRCLSGGALRREFRGAGA